MLPEAIRRASKHSVQTPQREWIRNEPRDWVAAHLKSRSVCWEHGWVDQSKAIGAMDDFVAGEGDTSFFLLSLQWINLSWWAEGVA